MRPNFYRLKRTNKESKLKGINKIENENYLSAKQIRTRDLHDNIETIRDDNDDHGKDQS